MSGNLFQNNGDFNNQRKVNYKNHSSNENGSVKVDKYVLKDESTIKVTLNDYIFMNVMSNLFKKDSRIEVDDKKCQDCMKPFLFLIRRSHRCNKCDNFFCNKCRKFNFDVDAKNLDSDRYNKAKKNLESFCKIKNSNFMLKLCERCFTH